MLRRRFSTSFGASRRVTELRRKLLDEVAVVTACEQVVS